MQEKVERFSDAIDRYDVFLNQENQEVTYPPYVGKCSSPDFYSCMDIVNPYIYVVIEFNWEIHKMEELKKNHVINLCIYLWVKNVDCDIEWVSRACGNLISLS